jgi:Family of unknown function (DUF6510)
MTYAGLDGNAAAGELMDVFGVDVTAAAITCAGCGRSGAVAELMLWGAAPGLVARCPQCTDVVLRVVRAPGRMFVEMRGALRMEIPLDA